MGSEADVDAAELDPGLREDLDALLARAGEAGQRAALLAYVRALDGAGDAASPAGPAPERFGMIGGSPAMEEVFGLLERVAPSDVPVLIQGETGTGKELVAKALHEHSSRAKKPFVAENCAAIPENLLESELFGHVKGAFTGAVQDRPGHFVAGDGGTVFLDEIGDMPLAMQAKLLRVLNDGEVRPVGSNKARKVNVRIVAATHRDLVQAVKDGAFREDLLFRLNVITLHLPPLREREGDIARLAHGLLPGICAEIGREVGISEAAVAELERRPFPGNVRELENELRRAAALCPGDVIQPGDLSRGA